jgi:protein TonB
LVSFAVDASGRVTSSRIARSSGSAELDRAALAMVQRASPLPAPPPELAGSSITVPAVFKPK